MSYLDRNEILILQILLNIRLCINCPSTKNLCINKCDMVVHQGPVSSTGLRRVFVLKRSYKVRTLKIGFHQTIELCELLTFCRIFKTNI